MQLTTSRRIVLLAFALVLFLLPRPGATDEKTRQILAERAERFVETIMRGQLSGVRGELTVGARRALTEEAMRQLFGRLTREGGGFREVGRATATRRPDGTVVAIVPVHFERLSLAAQILYEREGPMAKISEFSVVPLQADATRPTPTPSSAAFPELSPPYADARLFRRESSVIQIAGCEVPVALFVPAIAGPKTPAPTVLIMHPIRPDASSVRNGMTRDLMEGLATRGVAVASYRETECRDPKAVLSWLEQQPPVDVERITLAGYQEFGSLATDIASTSKTLSVVNIVTSTDGASSPTVFFYPRSAFAWDRDYPNHELATHREYSDTDRYLRRTEGHTNAGYVTEEFIADFATFARTGQMRP
ncbi:DUF3887 domain-containing protein [bacterium]|nr:DUF3887 domain-containing protein [bacterium]